MIFEEVILFTSQLEAQIEFYSKTLGLKIIDKQKDKVTFEIGRSLLTFKQRSTSSPYHFAINIPSNKGLESLDWIKNHEGLTLLKDGEIELQNFELWNAEAVYFYDPDKNIVEFIARKNLKNHKVEPFSIKQLLEISEIGVATKDLVQNCEYLQDKFSLPIYSGGLERFCAMGNETGLFILIDRKIKDWFPTGDQAFPSEFDVKIKLQDQKCTLRFRNDLLTKVE